MSVYVDEARWPFGRMLMCHMQADTREELDVMADQIGVARKWIQYPGTYREHYDICKSMRAKAVKLGAIEVDTQFLVEMDRKRNPRWSPPASAR